MHAQVIGDRRGPLLAPRDDDTAGPQVAEGQRLHKAGVPVETAVTQASFGDLESWTIRKSQGAIAIRRVYLELDGKLPK